MLSTCCRPFSWNNSSASCCWSTWPRAVQCWKRASRSHTHTRKHIQYSQCAGISHAFLVANWDRGCDRHRHCVIMRCVWLSCAFVLRDSAVRVSDFRNVRLQVGGGVGRRDRVSFGPTTGCRAPGMLHQRQYRRRSDWNHRHPRFIGRRLLRILEILLDPSTGWWARSADSRALPPNRAIR